jgi:glutamate dehydrogenase (NADP+)
MDLKNVRRGRIREYAERFPGVVYTPIVDRSLGYNPLWMHRAQCAFPSATQNEIGERDAAHLVSNGVIAVAEGANMPCTPEAVRILVEEKVLYAPGKAANAGGVATSGLEMAQNSARLSWPREKVDNRLRDIMRSIHRACRETAEEFGVPGNYVHGANIAGFLKVAEAMLEQGLV